MAEKGHELIQGELVVKTNVMKLVTRNQSGPLGNSRVCQ